MSKRLLPAVLVLFVMLLFPLQTYAQTVSELAKQFICQCGCTAVLDNCTHAECSIREEMLNLVKQRVEQGKTEAEIVSFFVGRYGEKVLASPPKQGFNLTAWILPFAAIFAGAAIVYMVIKKWVWRGRTIEIDNTADDSVEMDETYKIRLEKELKEFESRGFR